MSSVNVRTCRERDGARLSEMGRDGSPRRLMARSGDGSGRGAAMAEGAGGAAGDELGARARRWREELVVCGGSRVCEGRRARAEAARVRRLESVRRAGCPEQRACVRRLESVRRRRAHSVGCVPTRAADARPVHGAGGRRSRETRVRRGPSLLTKRVRPEMGRRREACAAVREPGRRRRWRRLGRRRG